MAKQKIDLLILGKGAINANTTSSQQFTSTVPMDTWSASTSYPVDGAVEYSGRYYRSLQTGNLNNQPDVSPTYWEVLSVEVRDGDVVTIVAGILSDIMVRNNGRWVSLLNVPVTVALADNTAAQLVVQVPLTIARGATIEYSVVRGLNERRGTLRYQSDGTVGTTGAALSDTNNVDVGAGDVGVTFDALVDGGGTNVQLIADTDSQGSSAVVKYTLRGWT
jgi:hypothetical protein